MMGEGRIHTKGKKVGHCRVSQRLLSMIVSVPEFIGSVQLSAILGTAHLLRKVLCL